MKESSTNKATCLKGPPTSVWSSVVDAATVLTSLAALYVAWLAFQHSTNEAQASRERERFIMEREELLWQPSVSFGYGINKDLGFYLSMRNSGPGVAKLKWVRMYLGYEQISDWDHLYESVGIDPTSPTRTYKGLSPEMVIPVFGANEHSLIFTEPNLELSQELMNRRQDLYILACVCSLLGRCSIAAGVAPDLPFANRILKEGKATCEFDRIYKDSFQLPPTISNRSW